MIPDKLAIFPDEHSRSMKSNAPKNLICGKNMKKNALLCALILIFNF